MCDKRDERLPASNDVTGRVVQHPRTEKIEIFSKIRLELDDRSSGLTRRESETTTFTLKAKVQDVWSKHKFSCRTLPNTDRTTLSICNETKF